MFNKIHKTVLHSGIRVLTLNMPSRRGVAAGVWIDSGSRDDPEGKEGLSHLTEHMMFKGTPSRSALDIARELESIGASEDGYTSQEETCYYIYLPGEQIARGMDILGDMVSNASIDDELFRREISVVASEMSDIDDTPSEIARDYFSTAVFGDHPLGHSILGYPSTVEAISRDDIVRFVEGEYCAPRLILAAVGNIDHEEFCGLVEKNFTVGREIYPKKRTPPAPIDAGKIHVFPKDTSQLSIYIGGRSFAFDDPRRYSIGVLDAILGRGPSSLLFHRLREEEGIGYRIFSFGEYFGDCGLWGIFANIDPSSTARFFEVVDSIFDDITDGTAVAERFDEIIQGVSGRIELQNDSVSGLLARLVETELYCGRWISPDETLERLLKLTPDDIVAVAEDILDRGKITAVCHGKSKSDGFPAWLEPTEGKLAR
ncbi:MAG TPA: insulinase family protein [candidate division Zixibacteria bacterium]|nr:insulinase family protein [candidate division Zixibacteria bacterium]